MNETEHHFQMQKLERVVREGNAEAYKVQPKEYFARLRAQNIRILLLLAMIVAGVVAVGYLRGAF